MTEVEREFEPERALYALFVSAKLVLYVFCFQAFCDRSIHVRFLYVSYSSEPTSDIVETVGYEHCRVFDVRMATSTSCETHKGISRFPDYTQGSSGGTQYSSRQQSL